MKNLKIIIITIGCLLLIGLVSLPIWIWFWKADFAYATNLRQKFSVELKQNDPQEKIEKVLRENGFSFSFDGFQNRYRGIIRNVSPGNPGDHAVIVYVNVDQQK
ncbi:MAG: hypothetical protein H7X92_02310 [Chitinophagales bacterium]|nr:hypothetical protein [Hyphomicrobiales bacterium]